MSSDALTPRQDADVAQQVFGSVLGALANPGRVGVLLRDTAAGSPARSIAPVLWPPLALADAASTFCVIDRIVPARAADATAMIARSTGARATPAIGHADLVVALAGLVADDLRSIRVGSIERPELGARLFLACGEISAEPRDGALPVWVAGPGAAGGRLMHVVGVDEVVFEELHVINDGFPVGVDLWLVADDGSVVGIPRSCRIEIVARHA